MSSIQKEPVDIIQSNEKTPVRYCVECGAKMHKLQKICSACGESQ